MRSASRSASSRYWVVSSTVVPSATSSSIVCPELQAAARVQARRRLVEEQDRRPGDERRREVQPPAHAAGVGLGRALGRVDELEAVEQLVGPRPSRQRGARRRGARPSTRFSRPVRFSSTAAYWPARPMRRAQLRRVVARRRARRRVTSPASGRSSVVRTRTAVVLPAPLGPSRPSTVPGGDLEVDAVERAHLAEGLWSRPRTRIADLVTGSGSSSEPRQYLGRFLAAIFEKLRGR